METLADKLIEYTYNLDHIGPLPEGIRIMNPFRKNPQAIKIAEIFYRKFYSDNCKRHLILGINPGRFGAGVTGITFTDTKRLREKCGIAIDCKETHEPSSVFIYEMIEAYGGVEKFYSAFILGAVCPLGFTRINDKGGEVNYNYYDSRELLEAVSPFIEMNVKKYLEFGISTDVCFCLGTGKNAAFLSELNTHLGIFGRIVPLEHPRFIMQYKTGMKDQYIDKYLNEFMKVM